MAKTKSELIDRDYGWARTVRSMAAAAAQPDAHVIVGWPTGGPTHVDSALGVSAIAMINELGNARIPARSMLGATFDQNSAKYEDAMRKIGIGITLGRIVLRRGLDLLGVMIKGDVQRRIQSGVPPPNAPSTIKRKGSSRPLINTGQMLQSIDHEVRGA